VIDSRGLLVGVATIARDITERIQSQLALEQVYSRERRIAETLQRSFLPDRTPVIEGYKLADSYSAALDEAAIGGDVYDVFRHPNGDYCLVIADVSGKGLIAAKYGAAIKYTVRAYAYRMESPADVLRTLNDSILQELNTDVFVTCFLGMLNVQTGQVLSANAGHDEPLFISKKTGKPVRLSVTGGAIGVEKGASYDTKSLRLASGDILFLYTDGVTDARGAEDKLGVEGLERRLERHCHLSAESLVDCVLDEVKRRSGDRLADDVAMLAIEAVE
jgi:sigma-B regulation protein RsbU (phosphoserine phosphatase)